MGEVMDGHVLESVRSVVFKESENLEGSCTKIVGYDFNKGVHYSELLKSMAFTGFQASNLGDAIQVVNQMLDWRLSDDPVAEDCNEEERDMAFREKVKCKIFLGFTSNLISSGLREIIRYLVQHHMVHVVVTTAGGVEEDLIKCLAPTYRGEFSFSGASLRSKGLNRIGNLLVPNINHSKFYDWIMPIFDNMLEEQETKNMLWTPSRLVARLGKEINDENSYLYWAYKNNIPVFCPALTDGKLGEMLYYHSFRNPGLVVDLVQDIRAVNGEAVHASPCKTGIIILGGGLPKHHICNANMMRNGADFAVFINTAQEYDGSDSGARPDEAVSWGKLRGSAKMVKVHCDATIAFPLLVAETFAQRGEAGKVGEVMEGNVQESLSSVVRNESKNLEGSCIKFEGYGSNHRVNYCEEKMGMEKVMKENVLESVRSVVFKESEDLEGSCNKVVGYDFNRGVNYSDLLKSLISTGFQASNLGDAIQVVNQMLDWRLSDEPILEDCNEEERDLTFREKVACKIFLGFTSNLISSGIRETVCYLVQHRMVDVVVTTAGGVEEDLIKCLAPTYKGEFSLSGAILRSKGLNRIGNLLVPNGNYCKFEDWILQILDQMLEEQETKNMLWTPSRLIARLGKEINDESSYLYWAYKNNIPVFCPGLTDGSLGDMLYFHSFRNPGLVVDLVQDIRAVNGEAVHASPRKTGMIILGGGLPKHHICNANMMRNGADYAVFINTAQEFDGSDSGASPDEAVSWGKLRGSAMMVKVHCDATIAFPLLVAETFAQRGGSKS